MGFLQSSWGITVVLDLFFGGFGAALVVAATLIDLKYKEQYSKAVFVGMWASFVCLAAGVCCLLLDVGQPFRAMIMPISFVNPTSWMTYGAWFMLFAVTFSLLSALIRTPKVLEIVKISDAMVHKLKTCFAIGAIIFGCAVIVYTGCLLSAAEFMPFWGTALVPATFVTLSLYCGFITALALVVSLHKQVDPTFAKTGSIIVLVLLVLSAIAVGLFTTQIGASQLLDASQGSLYTNLFWVCIVILGLIVPACLLIACLTKCSSNKALYITAAVCAGIGGFTWRYLILALGLHAPMVALSVKQMFSGFFL